MHVGFANFCIELFAFSLLSIKCSLYILILINCQLKAFSWAVACLLHFNGIFSYIETENLLLVRIHNLFLYDWCFLISHLKNNSLPLSCKYIILHFFLVKVLIFVLRFYTFISPRIYFFVRT